MEKEIARFIASSKNETLLFKEVLEIIDRHYIHQPAAFNNGDVENTAEQNQGSARVFSFARIHRLNEQDTLLLFAEHYQSVLKDPAGSSHQNIRQFMINGWNGVRFEKEVLLPR